MDSKGEFIEIVWARVIYDLGNVRKYMFEKLKKLFYN